MEDNLPKFYTPEQVEKILSISHQTFLNYVNRDENPLPVIYTSKRQIRVPVDQFEIWTKSLEN